MDAANDLGLDADDLFLWANSKNGRWLCDMASHRATRDLVAQYLNADEIADLKAEAV